MEWASIHQIDELKGAYDEKDGDFLDSGESRVKGGGAQGVARWV